MTLESAMLRKQLQALLLIELSWYILAFILLMFQIAELKRECLSELHKYALDIYEAKPLLYISDHKKLSGNSHFNMYKPKKF